MSNELAVKNATGTLTIRSMDDLARLGNMLAASGFFTDARDAAQAGVKVLAGLEMGIGAFSAMTGIFIIKGKPSIGAGLMAAAVKRSGKYDYRVRRHDNSGCEIEFFQAGESVGVSSFTEADAKAAGLLTNDNYKRNPKNMYFARALSNGVRWYTPDVFSASTYTPEELGAEVDGDGNVISVEAVAAHRPADPEPTEPEAPEALEPEQDVILGVDVKSIAAALKPLRLEADQARELISGIIERDVENVKSLTRAEGETLAGWTTSQFEEALDLQRTGHPEEVSA